MGGKPAARPLSATEAMVLDFAATQPDLGQFRVAESLRKRGIRISPSRVREIWKRHQLETLYKRVSAIEKRRGRARSRLTETQQARFKRAERRSQLLTGASAKPDGEDTKGLRQHLIVIAAQTFSRHGYKGATLKEIAQIAGILPGSVYHYFPSKQALFTEVHHEGFAELNAAVDKAIAHAKDPRARLEAACAAHLGLLVSGNTIAAFTGSSLFTPHLEVMTRRLIKDRDAYEARFREMVGALNLPSRFDKSVFRLALFGALNWTQVWYRPGKKSASEIAHDIVEIFCR